MPRGVRGPELSGVSGRFDPALVGICTALGHDVPLVGKRMLAKVKASVLAGARRNAAFITSCAQHCGQWSQVTPVLI